MESRYILYLYYMPTNTAGLKFINRRKAVIDIVRHADIMEDAIDRIIVKEAMKNPKWISLEEVKKQLDKKHGVTKVPGNSKRKGGKFLKEFLKTILIKFMNTFWL